jgi:hypothetical protein
MSLNNNTTTNSDLTPRVGRVTQLQIPLITLVGHIYIISILSIVGLLFNLLCFFVLASSRFKGDSYKYLVMKTLVHMAIQLFSTANSMYNCVTCQFAQTLAVQLYRYVFQAFVGPAANTCGALVEMALTYDRLRAFDHRGSKAKISSSFVPFKLGSFAILALTVVLNAPYLMAFTVKPLDANRTIYAYAPTPLVFAVWFRVYVIVLNVLQSLVSFVALLVMNGLLLSRFKGFMRRKKGLVTFQLTRTGGAEKEKTRGDATENGSLTLAANSGKKATSSSRGLNELKSVNISNSASSQRAEKQHIAVELNFTRMVCASSCLFTLTRLLLLVSVLSQQIIPMLALPVPAHFFPILTLTVQLTGYVYFSSNLFVYLWFNKQFRNYFFEMLFQFNKKKMFS